MPTDSQSYKGQITPQILANGPVSTHRCTDFFCFLIFAAFWTGVFFIAKFAITTGRPEAYMTPYDQFGKPCGLEDQAEYPYLYFIKEGTFKGNNTVCIEECPRERSSSIECSPDYSDAGKSCGNIEIYATLPFFKRFCLPTASISLNSIYKTHALEIDILFKAMGDLEETWWMILVVGAIALLIGFVYLLFMKLFAGLLIWSILLLFIASFAVAGAICFQEALGIDLMHITPKAMVAVDQKVLYGIGGFCFFVSALTLLLVCCFGSRITLAIAVLKAAANFIEDESSVLILSPIFFVKSFAFYAMWIVVAIYIVGTNEFRPHKNHYPIAQISWNDDSKAMMVYHIFGLFWNHAFDIALSQFIISSMVCIWYFKQGKTTLGTFSLLASIKRAIIHLGSIAYGSFLIGLLGFLRFALNYVHNRRNGITNQEHEARNFCVACCDCLLGCFQRSLQFLNQHAYIQIAMTGKSFCQASEDSFYLLLRNAPRIGVVHGLGSMFVFFGHILVTLSATFAGYLIITEHEYFKDNIYSPIIPCVVFFLTSLIIAHVFMGVYGMSADTIIHCFAMDEEMNNGNAVHAPESLRQFVDDNMDNRLLENMEQSY